MIDYLKYRLNLAKWSVRRWLPFETRGWLREQRDEAQTAVASMRAEFAPLRTGLSVSLHREADARQEASQEREKARFANEELALATAALTDLQYRCRSFFERLLTGVNVIGEAAAEMVESLPDHTPQSDERREVIEGLMETAEIDGSPDKLPDGLSLEVPFKLSDIPASSNGNGRHPGEDRILVLQHGAPYSLADISNADMVIELGPNGQGVVTKNRTGRQHRNVKVVASEFVTTDDDMLEMR